jgi:drug/metabolite transporter (DMT)-like permease
VRVGTERVGADGNPTHDLAIAAVVFATVCWSTGPLLVRGITAPTLASTPVRLAVAMPVMWAGSRFTGGRMSKDVWRVALVPGMLFAVSMLSAFASFSRTSIAHATLIPALHPALMLLVAPFLFGERLTTRKVTLSLVAVGGVAMVVLFGSSNGDTSLAGDLFAVVNLFSWSAYVVMAKKARDLDVHAGAFLACVMGVAAMVLMPVGIVAGADFGQINGNDWWLILGQVFLTGLVGHGIVTWSSRFLDITLISLINLLSPALSVVGAWIVFDQAMVPLQILGAVIMMVAVGAVVADRTRTLQPVRESLATK